MTSLEPLPHVYPFRFADRTLERTGPASGRVVAGISANAWTARAGCPPGLLAELIAQSALLVAGGDPELGKSGFLAGVSDFEMTRRPEPGDLLTVDVRLVARLGPVVRFEGIVTDDAGAPVARGAITVKQGTA